MSPVRITVETNDTKQEVETYYKLSPPTIEIKLDIEKTIKGETIFECFANLRRDYPGIRFLCKGSKLNVHPSRMSSQMSSGLLAYELTLGRQALRENLVNIFDFEDNNLTNDYEHQKQFFQRWMKSIRAPSAD